MPSEPSTFDAFYAEHFAPLAVQLYAYVGDLDTAEAVAHEAYCRALARWRRIEDPELWVRRRAWRLARSRTRRTVARRTHRVPATGRVPSPLQSAYVTALAAIPSRPRRVFVQHHLGGLALADICDVEGIPIARVRARLDKANARFAQQSVTVPATGSAAVPALPAPDVATLPPPADPFAGLEYADSGPPVPKSAKTAAKTTAKQPPAKTPAKTSTEYPSGIADA